MLNACFWLEPIDKEKDLHEPGTDHCSSGGEDQIQGFKSERTPVRGILLVTLPYSKIPLISLIKQKCKEGINNKNHS